MTVTAVQNLKKVYAKYKKTPSDDCYTSLECFVGDNYNLNSEMRDINAQDTYTDPDTGEVKHFSYWAVRKKQDGKLVAKCRDKLFSLCMMDNYFISPVYAGDGTEDTNTVTLDRSGLTTDNAENWLAWTWYDGAKNGEGKVVTPSSDLVFTNLRDNVIFVRVNTDQTTINENWSNVWNKTDDLTVTNGGTFKLTGWKGDSNKTMDGEWIRGITLEHMDYSLNRWTDDEGNVNSTGETDRLYTDFEVAFAEDFEKIHMNSSYRAGLVYEFCATVPDDKEFDPTKDYNAKSDETTLKQAIKDKANKYRYKGSSSDKERSIIVDEISTNKLTNRNRIQSGLGLKNNRDNSGKTVNANYLIKVSAYLIDGDEVYLSNPVYSCLRDISKKDLAAGEIASLPIEVNPIAD